MSPNPNSAISSSTQIAIRDAPVRSLIEFFVRTPLCVEFLEMLPRDVVLEIKRLLDEHSLSQREIAAMTGASRGIIGAIASGRRGLHGRDSTEEAPPTHGDPDMIAQRCSGCGGKVFMPCLLCRSRAYRKWIALCGPAPPEFNGNRDPRRAA